MRILVIGFESANPSFLFENEQLSSVRHLMAIGCWGSTGLQSKDESSDFPWPSLSEHLTSQGNRSVQVDKLAGNPMPTEPWDYLHFLEVPASRPDDYARLDQGIRSVLEQITDETIVLVLCLPTGGASRGSFVLAAPNNALTGPLEGVRLADLTATVLVLGGFPALPDSHGVPLALPISTEGISVDDEELVRERLRGLGYIA